MTTLPESDTATRKAELIKLMHVCYPQDSEFDAFPVWQNPDAAEPQWYAVRTPKGAGAVHCEIHQTYAEALEYWRWEWRLLDIQELVEALQLIDMPISDDLPPVDWSLFAGAGDMD